VFGVATVAFSLLAVLLAFAALITAGQAYSRSNDVKGQVAKIASGGVLGNTIKVSLQEYALLPRPTEVKAGNVRIAVDNVGSITHEMVVVRAQDAASLPIVKKAGERSVGAVDEEAIPESDKMGESGDVAAGKTVTKTFKLSPGTYVLFCNIDNRNTDGTVVNHFVKGMRATITVQ
jgi:uncharacterized cupredoxin-like copper-binding protein